MQNNKITYDRTVAFIITLIFIFPIIYAFNAMSAFYFQSFTFRHPIILSLISLLLLAISIALSIINKKKKFIYIMLINILSSLCYLILPFACFLSAVSALH